MERHERVIEYVRCYINDFILEHEFNQVDEIEKDYNQFQRIFVLTNQGIQIMKDIP